MSHPPPLIQACLLLLVIPAAVWDIRCRRIPNGLSLAGVLLGLGLNGFLYQIRGVEISLQGIGLALLIYLPLYLLRAMGAGDVKLMAAVGAIVGWQNWLVVFVLTSLFGAFAAVVVVARKGLFRRTFRNILLVFTSLSGGTPPHRESPELDVQSDLATRLPHAVAIACGSLGYLIAAMHATK
jgi:prepilin peptidase CpaA